MNTEIRNEILMLLNYTKKETEEDKKFYLNEILERFEYDIENRIKELDYEKSRLQNDLEVVEYARKELGL